MNSNIDYLSLLYFNIAKITANAYHKVHDYFN